MHVQEDVCKYCSYIFYYLYTDQIYEEQNFSQPKIIKLGNTIKWNECRQQVWQLFSKEEKNEKRAALVRPLSPSPLNSLWRSEDINTRGKKVQQIMWTFHA